MTGSPAKVSWLGAPFMARPSPTSGHKQSAWEGWLRLRSGAALSQANSIDFKGNLLGSRRQLAREYKATLNWSASVLLEEDIYTSHTRYDALNRPIAVTAPDHSVIHPAYNEANLLKGVEVNLRGVQQNGEPAWTPFVTNIDYDAKGQRTSIDYGNGVRTTYTYDPLTLRLVHLLTRRDAREFGDDCPDPSLAGWPGCQVQNLRYNYDPAGNITHIRDDAQQSVYFRNRRVEPSAVYTYDATYRLIEATGREHLGQTGGAPNAPTAPDAFNSFHTRLEHPADGNAMGKYLERYIYDAVGNFLQMQHRGSDRAHPGWTRAYAYNETSQIEASKLNNRLSHTTIGSITEPYHYDGPAGLHGNITRMPHLPLMQWDYRDQLQATSQQLVTGGTPETTWYVYDAAGQRVRKVTARALSATDVATGRLPTRMKERIYLGAFEIYREFESEGTLVMLERETFHVMDGKRRIAVVETKAIDAASPPFIPTALIRYQLGNHLGSTSLELDGVGAIISYEEYFPYGSTSYQAVRSGTETSKRYRYTSKERDEENGLYYHGARYYASWIGTWTSADPNVGNASTGFYRFAASNPLRFVDPDGKADVEWDLAVANAIDRWGVDDFAAGVGDTMSFGLTRIFRQSFPRADTVNYESGSYTAGEVGATLVQAAAGAGGITQLVSSVGRREAIQLTARFLVVTETSNVILNATDPTGTSSGIYNSMIAYGLPLVISGGTTPPRRSGNSSTPPSENQAARPRSSAAPATASGVARTERGTQLNLFPNEPSPTPRLAPPPELAPAPREIPYQIDTGEVKSSNWTVTRTINYQGRFIFQEGLDLRGGTQAAIRYTPEYQLHVDLRELGGMEGPIGKTYTLPLDPAEVQQATSGLQFGSSGYGNVMERLAIQRVSRATGQAPVLRAPQTGGADFLPSQLNLRFPGFTF